MAIKFPQRLELKLTKEEYDDIETLYNCNLTKA